MKKFFATLMVLVMALSLVACAAPAAEEAPVVEEAPVEEAVVEEAPAEEAAVEEAPAADGVNRIIVWNTAVADLTSSEQPRGAEMRVAYAFADVVAKCEIAGTEPCQVIGSDGYAADEMYDDLMQKYLTLEGESAPIVVGEAQDPDWAVWEVAYVRVGNDVMMACIKDEYPVADVFAAVGMVEADSYDFVCADGYVHNVLASEIAECTVKLMEDGGYDGTAPGLGDYTLYDLLYIQPAA